jgi:hypothetical protein
VQLFRLFSFLFSGGYAILNSFLSFLQQLANLRHNNNSHEHKQNQKVNNLRHQGHIKV